jgi:hypothetical protein
MTFQDPGAAALANFDATMTAAPELSSAPGLTSDVALGGGDLPGAAQAITAGAKAQMGAKAANGVGGIFGDIFHDATKVLNLPMEQAQHTYRYLHDVEARHGKFAAIMEGLGIGAGIAAGSVLTGGLGDALLGVGGAAELDEGAGVGEEALSALKEAGVSKSGGALSKGFGLATKVLNPVKGEEVTGGLVAGDIEGSTSYKDSWQRTANGNTYRDPHTGQMVSFGRDIAGGLLDLDHTSSSYNDVSGVLDGIFDIDSGNLPGLNALSAAHTAEGMRGLVSQVSPRLQGYSMDADQADRLARMDGPYRRFLQFAAGESSRSKILAAYPHLAPIVDDKQYLDGAATTIDDIQDADLYHGTAYGEEGFDPQRDIGTHGGDQLRGPGFYTTDSKRAGLSYTDKRDDLGQEMEPVAKRVYSLRWAGDNAPKLLDLRVAGNADAESLGDAMHDALARRAGVDNPYEAGEFAPPGNGSDTDKFWDAMNDPSSKGSDLWDAWNRLLDEHFRSYDGERDMTAEGHALSADLTHLLQDKGYDGWVDKGGQHIGGVGKHTARGFFDPSKLAHVATTEVRDARMVTSPGLASASTIQEAHAVVMNRAILGTEAIGHKLPTMSGAKLAMTALRERTADLPVNNLHPFAGLLNPKTTIGNVRKLFLRTPVGVKGSLAKLDPHLVEGLVKFWTAGVGDAAAQDAADKLFDLNMVGRKNLVNNMFLNNLAAYAGVTQPILKERLGEELDEEQTLGWLQDPKIRSKIKDLMSESFNTNDPDGMGVYGGRTDGNVPRLRWDPSGRKVAVGLLRSQASDDYTIPDLNEFHHMAKLFANGHAALGSIDEALFNHVTARMKALMLSTGAAYATHMAGAEDALNAQRLGLGTLIDGGLAASVGKSQWRALNADYEAVAKAGGTRFLGRGAQGNTLRQIGVVARTMRRAGRVLGVDLNAEQIARIQRFAARSISRFLTEDDARYAAQFAIQTEGHMVSASLSNLHSQGLDDSQTLNGTIGRLRYKAGNRYEQITRGEGDDRYVPDHQSWLRLQSKDSVHQAAADALRKAHLRGVAEKQAIKEARAAAKRAIEEIPKSEAEGLYYTQMKAVGSPATRSPIDDAAADIVENVRAATYSPRTFTPNGKLLDHVAEGEQASLRELAQIPAADRPHNVPGRVLVPNASNLVDRVTESDFQHIAQPIIASLARMPTATATYIKYAKAYEKMVADGRLTAEMAAVKAAADTEIDMVRFVHNPPDRVQLDMFMRNWAPFLFAQNQAYRRGLRLLADDPAAFMRYYRSIVGVASVAHQMTDGQGNEYISIPGAGFLTHPILDALSMIGVANASLNPTGFGGTLSSANVIFPMSQGVRPDLSPIIIFPSGVLNGMIGGLGKAYPSFSKDALQTQGALNWVVGSDNIDESTLQQIIPNSIAANIIATGLGSSTSFNSTMMNVMQNLDYQHNLAIYKWEADGRRGPQPQIVPDSNASPATQQQFIQRVKNQTRIAFMLKTVLGALSPLGAEVTVNDFGLSQDLNNDINKAVAAGKGVDAGYTEFLAKHPDATPYTVSKSTTIQGESLPESEAAQKWVTDNMAKINANPAYLLFMPQSTNQNYDPAVYAEQVADGLRTRDTPSQYLDKLYTAAGDQNYYAAYDIHVANIKAAGSNSAALNTEYSNWDAYVQYLAQQQPIWWSTFSNGQKASDAMQSITQLRTIYAAHEEPDTPMARGIGGILDNLTEYEDQYEAAGQSSDYASAQKQVVDNWQALTAQWATNYPELSPVINSVFRDALYSINPGENS